MLYLPVRTKELSVYLHSFDFAARKVSALDDENQPNCSWFSVVIFPPKATSDQQLISKYGLVEGWCELAKVPTQSDGINLSLTFPCLAALGGHMVIWGQITIFSVYISC